MLQQRILTALILVALVGGLLFYASAQTWQIFVYIAAALAAWEWAALAGFGVIWQRVLSVMGMVLSLTWLSFFSDAFAFLVVLQWVVVVLLVGRYQHSEGVNGIKSPLFIMLAGWLSIGLFATAFIALRNEFTPSLLLFSMALIWAMDTGAYFSGRAFGKRKLARFASPGKSWEGVYGGGLLALFVALLGLWQLQLSLVWSIWVVAGLLALIALLSVYGDLFESVLKRQAGVKDSGRILPGHGGVLDRVDSLIVALPLFLLLWQGVLL